MPLFSGSAWFSHSTPSRVKSIWKRNGGSLYSPSSGRPCVWFFCSNLQDEELLFLAMRPLVTYNVEWVIQSAMHGSLLALSPFVIEPGVERRHSYHSSDYACDSCDRPAKSKPLIFTSSTPKTTTTIVECSPNPSRNQTIPEGRSLLPLRLLDIISESSWAVDISSFQQIQVSSATENDVEEKSALERSLTYLNGNVKSSIDHPLHPSFNRNTYNKPPSSQALPHQGENFSTVYETTTSLPNAHKDPPTLDFTRYSALLKPSASSKPSRFKFFKTTATDSANKPTKPLSLQPFVEIPARSTRALMSPPKKTFKVPPHTSVQLSQLREPAEIPPSSSHQFPLPFWSHFEISALLPSTSSSTLPLIGTLHSSSTPTYSISRILSTLKPSFDQLPVEFTPESEPNMKSEPKAETLPIERGSTVCHTSERASLKREREIELEGDEMPPDRNDLVEQHRGRKEMQFRATAPRDVKKEVKKRRLREAPSVRWFLGNDVSA